MDMQDLPIQISFTQEISSISKNEWDRLAGSDVFASYAFYLALENSLSVGEATGWTPVYVLAKAEGRLVGIMPSWIKAHSYGEYVFDHAIADAYERSGRHYYPKLLAAAPFTPVTGRRWLANSEEVTQVLIEGFISIVETNQLSSAHINFASTAIQHPAFIERTGVQYHFHNSGYKNFDDFLASLSASKRKMIKKERKGAQSHGLKLQMKTGGALDVQDWDCFWHCYQDTGARKWGQPYLTRAFFDEISKTLSDKMVMGLAYDGDVPVAAALHFLEDNRLLGRYWGALHDYKYLHLELCYYQAIEYAIDHKIPLVEAGAQGEHKIARGYAPELTKSYHYFREPEFRSVIKRYFQQEHHELERYAQACRERLPFPKGTRS